MDPGPRFDTLKRFAEIERLAAKVYFRFSHLFLGRPELRDFWWQMGMDEERHACILLACREIAGEPAPGALPQSDTHEKAEEFESRLTLYLTKGTRSISLETAFRIAMEIETSELDTVYERLLLSCGSDIARRLGGLGVTNGEQRARLKHAIFRFCSEPDIRAAAQGL